MEKVMKRFEFNIDWALILTVIGVGIAVVSTNISLIAWLRSDMKAYEIEIRAWKEEIHKETKDFHGRLCAIEQSHKMKE